MVWVPWGHFIWVATSGFAGARIVVVRWNQNRRDLLALGKPLANLHVSDMVIAYK